MVFKKLKEKFSSNDEKFEILYYKYSKIKLENQKIRNDSLEEMKKFKLKLHEDMARKLISIYEEVEIMKSDSFKVRSTDKEIQRLLMDVNKIEKTLKEQMKQYSIEEVTAEERFYDPEIHEVASYQDAKGMKKGIIMKTVKKGFKYKNNVIKKPKVVVTK